MGELLKTSKRLLVKECGESDAAYKTEELLAWASEVSEQSLVLDQPIFYLDTPLCGISTTRLSYSVREYLIVIFNSRFNRPSGGLTTHGDKWWSNKERDALDALASIREALELRRKGVRNA